MTYHILTNVEYAWIMSVALHFRALIFWDWGPFSGTQPMLLPARIWERMQ